MVKVWAPDAKTVELATKNGETPLHRGDRGWWTSDRSLEDGADYQFRVDGDLLPDPRSPWQPFGVHGPSRHVDHDAFPWSDAHWQARPLSSAVLYELHVGTFTPEGTFDAATSKLNHLVDLGVTHIEIMPVAEFLGEYGWGYDGVSLYAPHHAYGGPDGLKRFVDACHAAHLGVILDVVYNHIGPSGNYLPRFGPYFHSDRKTPWGDSLNFDGPHSDEVRRYFCDNALMWLRDYHFDGLRLDAVHAIHDASAVHLLEELAVDVDELKARLGRHLVLIAESDLNDPRIVRPWELGGFGLDAQWSDDIHHAVHTVLSGERGGYYRDFGTIGDLATAMTRPYVYAGRYSEHRQRRHGRPPIKVMANRFIAYVQNHDQLGNRAKGDRLSHLVSHDRTKLGAALVLLGPYVPMLFQGEEWAATAPFQYFVDFAVEPELAMAVQEGRRREFAEFGWRPDEIADPTDRATFLRSKLGWEEADRAPHKDMLAWYRSLIALRRCLSALTTGRLDGVTTAFSEEEQWLRVDRDQVMIAVNFANEPRLIPRGDARTKELLLSSKPLESLSCNSGSNELSDRSLLLPGESVAVLGSEACSGPF
jgi:maltooligosyltrehalose trehalohydrolase